MFRIAEDNFPHPKYAADFVGLMNDLPPDLGDFFNSESEIYVARAPGRLDVMGGIADYSGSLVLEMPIAEATFAALQKTPERKIKIISLNEGENLNFEMPLDDFTEGGLLISYEKARRYFLRTPENHWAAYAAGIFLTLMRERGARFSDGARILIRSDIPAGKGVSSSAALEAAVMYAVCGAFEIAVQPREAALLCQKTENLIVGAPCGVMDQMTVVCGEEDRLLALLCQPAELIGTIRIPDEIEFWGIDSGVRHAVTGADYGAVRVGAFMGYRIIAEIAGLKAEILNGSLVKIEDERWHGFLANVAPSEFETKFSSRLPEKISGAEFLEKYQGTTDRVTVVDPERTYAVKKPTAHAVYEHFRVRAFAELLKNPSLETERELLGELMFQSHAGYAACGLCEAGTNRLVELVRESRTKNLYGAKITGGGSGGTVAILARRGAESAALIREIAERYEFESGFKPYIFRGSSAGVGSFGFFRLKKDW